MLLGVFFIDSGQRQAGCNCGLEVRPSHLTGKGFGTQRGQ